MIDTRFDLHPSTCTYVIYSDYLNVMEFFFKKLACNSSKEGSMYFMLQQLN